MEVRLKKQKSITDETVIAKQIKKLAPNSRKISKERRTDLSKGRGREAIGQEKTREKTQKAKK